MNLKRVQAKIDKKKILNDTLVKLQQDTLSLQIPVKVKIIKHLKLAFQMVTKSMSNCLCSRNKFTQERNKEKKQEAHQDKASRHTTEAGCRAVL